MLRGETALTIAANRGNFELVKVLVQEGKADVNLPDKVSMKTPLMHAIRRAFIGKEYIEIVRFLIDHNANIDQKDLYGQNAINYAKYGLSNTTFSEEERNFEEVISILTAKEKETLEKHGRQQP